MSANLEKEQKPSYHRPQVCDYHRPQVRDYGSIKEITAHVDKGVACDNGGCTHKT